MLTPMTKTSQTLREERPPLTVPEAAAELRVSPVTLRRWIAQGLVLAVRPAKAYLVPAVEVDRLLTPSSKRAAAK
jgi:excisionase family DNA binding protein